MIQTEDLFLSILPVCEGARYLKRESLAITHNSEYLKGFHQIICAKSKQIAKKQIFQKFRFNFFN